MAMNEQIREIIDLDRHASAIASEAKKKSKIIAEETNQRIKARREEVLQDTKVTCQQNYEVQMQRAQHEKDRIVSEMNLKLDRVRQAYQRHKKEWAAQILEELLQSGN